MKRLLGFLSPYKKECVLAPLFKMLEATFELFVPLVVAALIDTGIAGQDERFILTRGGLLLLLAVLGMASSITAQYFAAKAAAGFATDVRQALFSHIQKLSFSELDTVGTSTLITRETSDINQAQNAVNMFLRLFLRSPFIVFGAMLMAFTVDARAALIFVVAVPLLAVVVVLIMRLTMPLYRTIQERLDRLTLQTREALSGARVIRAFGREKAEEAAFGEENSELNRLQRLTGRIAGLTNPITYVIVNLATIALLFVGGRQVSVGALTQGQVVALVNYMAQILVELIKLANLIVTITKGLACADRVADVLAIEPDLTGPQETDEPQTQASRAAEQAPHDPQHPAETAPDTKDAPTILLSHVNLRYHGAAADALSDITLTARAGETIGIIGGTGSGKSSVVQLLPRLYDVAAGSVAIDGKDVRDWDLTALRQKIGMVPQKAALFSGTVRENLCFGTPDATDPEIWEVLRIAQAEEFIREKEGALDFVIEQGGANLSGGQRQRLTIARALVRKPAVLILDDATSALDFATEAALRKGLRTLSPKPTTFLVSQRVSSLLSADRILVLDDGKSVGLGTHDELLESCPIYREIYESQTEDTDEA